MLPHLHIPSSLIGIMPRGRRPARCASHSLRVTASRRVLAVGLISHFRESTFCLGSPCVPCADANPENRSIKRPTMSMFALSISTHQQGTAVARATVVPHQFGGNA